MSKRVIIVDVDGTLAHRGTRNPYDMSKVNEDSVDEIIANLVRLLASSGFKIIVVSGRDGSFFNQTWDWLVGNEIPFAELLMRPFGDKRKDSIVKEEIFNNNIKDKYQVEFVLDDRKQVVEMWRELGLKVLQVDQGDF